jgi:hypothetical protein
MSVYPGKQRNQANMYITATCGTVLELVLYKHGNDIMWIMYYFKHHINSLLLFNLNFNKQNIFFYLKVTGKTLFAVLLKHSNKAW